MTVMHDVVTRVTMPDGSPAPELLEHPGKCDIVFVLPILYVSWTVGSFGLVCVMLILNNNMEEECVVSGGVLTLFSLVSLSTALSIWATIWILIEAC